MEFFNDVGGDPLKPSLFELVAQEQLRDLLQPALKYVLSVRVALLSYKIYILSIEPILGVCAEVPSIPSTTSQST